MNWGSYEEVGALLLHSEGELFELLEVDIEDVTTWDIYMGDKDVMIVVVYVSSLLPETFHITYEALAELGKEYIDDSLEGWKVGE